MKRSIVVIVGVMLMLAGVGQATTSITLDVYAASAANGSGSPSWSSYATNALYALENGLSSYGNRAISPTGYERAPDVVYGGEIAVTSFKSWRGQLNPTGAFANEYGNRMHFGLHASGNGTTQFRLADLTFALTSSDIENNPNPAYAPPGTGSLGYVGNFIGRDYNGTTRYGINWGADRVKGGGDDIVYASGNGTTLVDELVYVGVGNAWWPMVTPELPTAQAAMDDYFAWINSDGPIDVTCSYTILGYTGTDSVQIAPVPEPITMSLVGMGIVGLGGYIRRRMKVAQ